MASLILFTFPQPDDHIFFIIIVLRFRDDILPTNKIASTRESSGGKPLRRQLVILTDVSPSKHLVPWVSPTQGVLSSWGMESPCYCSCRPQASPGGRSPAGHLTLEDGRCPSAFPRSHVWHWQEWVVNSLAAII